MRRPCFRCSSNHGRPAARRGYTLLEVILALAIGAFLLAGLYFGLNLHVRATNVGRRVTERAEVARQVANRIQSDILTHLSAVDANFQQAWTKMANQAANQAANGGSGNSSSTSGSGTPASGTGTTSPTTGGTTTGSGATGPNPTNAANPQGFNLMVQGDNGRLVLYSSRVPRAALQAIASGNGNNAAGAANNNAAAGPNASQIVSDLRRITYWLAGAGSNTGASGLARQETTAVTSADDINNLPPNIGDESPYVIAPQVANVVFQYFDGSAWQDSWDGTQVGSDGQTPMGPPAAIAITITITQPTARTPTGGQQSGGANAPPAETYQYRHVVAIPTANSFLVQSSNASGTSGASGSSGSSTGGN